jgi:hypothetical protein
MLKAALISATGLLLFATASATFTMVEVAANRRTAFGVFLGTRPM